MKKFILVLALASCFPVQAATLRVIYLVDKMSYLIGDDMTVACRSNQAMMNEVFQKAADSVGVAFEPFVLTGPSGSPSAVMRFLNNMLRIDPDDTLVFFYCGHGVTTVGGHTFAQSNGRITRATIREGLLRHRARLTLLLSDTCSNYGLRAPTAGNGLIRGSDPKAAAELLFKPSGFVDMTAASPGEYSVFDEEDGGFFTIQLARTLWEDSAFLDSNKDGRVSWKEVFPVVRVRTNEYLQWYKSTHPIWDPSQQAKTQFPSVWTLPND